jgi:hypothetical protein
MDVRRLLVHELAAIAYRAQKALRGAPDTFSAFRAASGVRTPAELVRHMAGVLGYARTFFIGGEYRVEPLSTFRDEINRFHENLERLREHVLSDSFDRITPQQLLQGPMSDVMSHVGQLGLLRRLAGSPIPPENFIYAEIDGSNLTPSQAPPAAPDAEWLTAEEGSDRS